ncbi:EscU/YscU/HrcU family type III secretion system export apparatus switch protein [Sinanaerobacter chloroacetimidivorans]|jgi:flagellar biosynthesis protein|uniref:EscU/YscU/HrcU family type III secretion system export apparatus switch protein n=1 Tax=Sinanaerobacter chloroacetimidivorans TaxID=2818044 RepID=A0A8J7W256_9FIRM|nr:EscU/YscU/HrcU family type III secretion system export apparatus switch protein [Sinanaerobacter chloroacetimidivorans]MBR0597515.1 EscU/YscU/HrcU family type III secretion system export apparatus switch protein [Sinanaerobacter chloroacetimidivorans]
MSKSKEPLKVKNKASTLSVAALRYDQAKNTAPCVVAAGTGHIAQKILQVAMENGIAIYHDDSAATLLAKLELGQEIPPELYQIVVDIYISLLNVAEETRR